jgi:hypothetical protein
MLSDARKSLTKDRTRMQALLLLEETRGRVKLWPLQVILMQNRRTMENSNVSTCKNIIFKKLLQNKPIQSFKILL